MAQSQVGISRESAEFLMTALAAITLSVGAPDFEEMAEKMVRVRRELRSGLEA